MGFGTHRMDFEWAIAADGVGEVDVALEVTEQLIARQDLPANFNEAAKSGIAISVSASSRS